MSQETLNQLKDFIEASKHQKAKEARFAYRHYLLALEQLSKNLPENNLDCAYIHSQIATCAIEPIIQTLFGSTFSNITNFLENKPISPGVDARARLAIFNDHLAKARELSQEPQATKWGRTIAAAIAKTKAHLSNRITEKTREWIATLNYQTLNLAEIEGFLAKLENVYQGLEKFLVSDSKNYMVNARVAISKHYLENANKKASRDQQIANYQLTIQLLTQATQLVSLQALVKPAEIYFNKWFAHEQIAVLSNNNQEKLAQYQSIVKETETMVLGRSEELGRDYYGYRPTQYAYSLFFAHKAHLELAKLAPSELERQKHKTQAEELQKEFTELSAQSKIIIEELPELHQPNMLIAIQTLAPNASRKRPASYTKEQSSDDSDSSMDSDSDSYDDSSSSVDSDYEETKDTPAAAASKKRKFGSASGPKAEKSNQTPASAPKKPKSETKPGNGAAAQKFFSSASAVSRAWYTDETILATLDRRLRAEINRNEVLVFGGIQLEDLCTHIQNRKRAQLDRQGHGEQVAQRFAISVNVARSHWIAVCVDFNRGFNHPPRIYYADPLGHPRLPALVSMMNRNFPGAEVQESRTRYQNNGYDCGPWTVAILERLGKGQAFPAREAINIPQRRQEDFQVWRQHNAPRNSAKSVSA